MAAMFELFGACVDRLNDTLTRLAAAAERTATAAEQNHALHKATEERNAAWRADDQRLDAAREAKRHNDLKTMMQELQASLMTELDKSNEAHRAWSTEQVAALEERMLERERAYYEAAGLTHPGGKEPEDTDGN